MWELITFPFRMIGSLFGLIFDLIGSIFGFVFSLVGGIFGLIFGGAFFILVIIGIVALVRWIVQRQTNT